MFFEQLRGALLAMPQTGDAGFEGLVATLLSTLTGDRFYVARSGDQPADAVASAADIAMQAKRYDKTAVDETKFEGEFAQACRLIPNLDCYVFAMTRQTAQLRVLAKELQEKEGVDIIVLGLDRIDSELPALCVTFWQQVKHFTQLNKLGSDFAEWASSQAAEPDIAAIVVGLREQLRSSIPLAAMVRRRLHAYLKIRFGIDRSSRRAIRFPLIDLPSAVRRAKPHLLLNEWWRADETKAALLLGEEGMGKTVVGADFSRAISEAASALVLWLDSLHWSGTASIEGIVESGLKHAGFADEKLRQRLVRKALKRWSSTLVIVLDGVNEKDARETAHRLLADLDARGTSSPRLLFTSRQIPWRADERALWQTGTEIPVRQFTDSELAEALRALDPPVPVEELPDSLIELAKIPRYFKRAVELRAQFKSLRQVSREMVLWVDLLDKIDSGESQLTETIGWKSPSDLKRAMTKLATAALRLPAGADITGQGYSVLQETFEDFDRTRLDLAEQRIVIDPTSDHPSLNRSHIILGFALHLGAIASVHGDESVDELADRLRRELEPLLSQDYLTEALFVALQLSALPARAPYALTSRASAALLFTWASSQNANVDAERLAFWVSQDPAAYLDFLEELFVAPVSDGWTHQLIEPLKLVWKAGNADPLIDGRLRTWLTLIWRRELQSQVHVTEGKHQLRVARNQHQLILSNVALAVLAENPVPTFLKDLAVAAGTDHLSREEHGFTDPATGKKKTQGFPCKHLDNNLGPVLRWRFTESVKPQLEVLAAESQDSVIAKGARDLIESFDVFGWRWGRPNIHSLRDRLPLFPCTAEEATNRFIDIPEFAARDDLPSISSHDEAIIASKVEAAFASPQLGNNVWNSSAAMDLDYDLAWFARYRPERLSEIGASFRLKALGKEKAWLALDLANDLPYSRQTVPPNELLRALKDLILRTPEDASERYDGSLLEAHVLAFTCFGPDDLRDWLVLAAGHKRARAHIHFWQVHVFCRYIADDIAVFAREQAKRCCNEEADESDLSGSEFDYWAAIGGTAGPPDVDYHRWVDAEIRRRVPTGHRRFYWRLLWLRTASQEVLASHVADGSIFEFFTEDGFRALLFANRGISDWTDLTASIDTLLELIPLDEVGAVLHLAKRDEDLARWGHVIFAQALERVGRPPFERQFWGTTILERDSAGRIGGSTCDRERPVSESKEELRPKTISFQDHAQHFSVEEKNHEANAALKVWHGDLDALRDLDHGALSQFNALQALKAWRDQNPDEFKTYSKELLAGAVIRPADAYHVGGFIAAVVDALLLLDPDRAYESHCALQDSPMRVSIVNDYGQPTFAAGLWACAKEDNERAAAICRRLCESATTDEEIANHAITAVAEGAAEMLLSMCNDLLGSDLAKQRALAVSLLAWVPLDPALDRLRQLVQSDPSGWIRTHAAWALEVAQHERAIRQYYRDTLKVTDINSILSRLQVLLPALTISAASWHRHIEDDELAKSTPKEIEAALSGFWYNFRHRSKTPPKSIMGRALREYLRGECIRDLRAPKPRLLELYSDLTCEAGSV